MGLQSFFRNCLCCCFFRNKTTPVHIIHNYKNIQFTQKEPNNDSLSPPFLSYVSVLEEKKGMSFPDPAPSLKVMTWNIQELLWYSSAKTIKNILFYLQKQTDTDVICLQECFHRSSMEKIINDGILRERYPYHATGDMVNKWNVGMNSGLLVLSKYNIINIQWQPLHGLKLPDVLANKGVLYFTTGQMHFATTHLQSKYQKTANEQLQFLCEHRPHNDTIILGDLNTTEADIQVNRKYVSDKITWDQGLRLDYIIPTTPDIHVDVWVDYIPLFKTSDHWPVHGYIHTDNK